VSTRIPGVPPAALRTASAGASTTRWSIRGDSRAASASVKKTAFSKPLADAVPETVRVLVPEEVRTVILSPGCAQCPATMPGPLAEADPVEDVLYVPLRGRAPGESQGEPRSVPR
jgi:hypothetical protein